MSKKNIAISVLIALLVGVGSFTAYKVVNKPQPEETLQIEQQEQQVEEPTDFTPPEIDEITFGETEIDETEKTESSETQEKVKAEAKVEEAKLNETADKNSAGAKEQTQKPAETKPVAETPKPQEKPKQEKPKQEVKEQPVSKPQTSRQPKDWGVCDTPPANPVQGDTFTDTQGYIVGYDANVGWYPITTSGDIGGGGGATGGGVLFDDSELSGDLVGNWG